MDVRCIKATIKALYWHLNLTFVYRSADTFLDFIVKTVLRHVCLCHMAVMVNVLKVGAISLTSEPLNKCLS